MLIVDRIGPLATIQDRGRRGLAHQGIPPSGPLDPEAFALATRAVGATTAIELPLVGARFTIEGQVLASIDGESPRLFEGFIEVAPCARAVRYLAVRGGFDVPVVLGARATLPTAGIGGFHGRSLRVGDRIAIGTESATPRLGRSVAEIDAAPIALITAPDTPMSLFSAIFSVDSRSDRIGTRLAGDALATDGVDRLSRPLVPGAIQLPPDGHPIVIGPDGPTTGGYLVVGVLPLGSRARLARIRPGSPVRFTKASPETRF